jgi:hypothetical protein
MWSLLKFLVFLTLIACFLWFGTHVKMGQYTLFGHFSRIWNTPEAQDLVKGVREGSGPAIDKMKRGVKAGVDEATKPETLDAGVATMPAKAVPAKTPAEPAATPPLPAPAADAGATPARHSPPKTKKKRASAGT